ncbi:MAG: GMC family oxidoreductase [Acidobacteriaceae bacterium]|nr:GMC family oxidoreductase [Acidobacteriaceae bacterium]
MFRLRCLAILLLAACASARTTAHEDDALHAVHNALFESFIPVDQPGIDPELEARFTSVRDGIWASASNSVEFRRLLLPLLDLRSFGKSCGMTRALNKSGSVSFAELSPVERQHVLLMLSTCDLNQHRILAMTLRYFYIGHTYEPLQEGIAGVDLNLAAPRNWIDAHRPSLPTMRLRFDPAAHEVSSVGGPIDYLIVGSGPAGSVLAHELRRGGKRVLLVERGSLIVPGSMQTRMIGDLLDSRRSVDGGIIIHNGMAVGGGTQVNVDLCFAPTLPAVQTHIDMWRNAGRIGTADFTYEQMAAAYRWVRSAIGTRSVADLEINRNNRVLWDGAVREGLHPQLYDLNTYPPGKSPYPVTDKRSSESQLLLDALEDTKNPLLLLPDADVRRVLFDAEEQTPRAIGIEVRTRSPFASPGAMPDPNHLGIPADTTVLIHARTIILCAGALGSPTILLRSRVANDNIGRGVVLHPSMPIIGKFDNVIDALDGTQASVYVGDRLVQRGYALESMAAEPEYVAIMSPGTPEHTLSMIESFRHLAGFGVMLVDTPNPDNRLTVDADGEPVVNYQICSADKARFREGIKEAVRVMFQGGAREVYLPTFEKVVPSTQADAVESVVVTNIREAETAAEGLQFIPNETILTSAHMQATDKMGASPSDSVVGRDFHVWGTRNLYVVDGSVFPTSVGANPMQTIYTVAKIFADRASTMAQHQ